jgi:hypothetical protein
MVSMATIIPDYGRTHSPRLRRFLWITTKIAIVLTVVAGLAFGVWWWAVLRPFRRLDAMIETPAARAASPAEFRAAAHDTLRFYCPYPHDAFLVLIEYGDNTSVPVLIRSLRWKPDTPPYGVMDCTKAHCLEALRKLTGQDRGKNYDDWAPLIDVLPTSQREEAASTSRCNLHITSA